MLMKRYKAGMRPTLGKTLYNKGVATVKASSLIGCVHTKQDIIG